MCKRLLLFLIFMSVGISVRAQKTLIIAAEDDASPWSMKDGTGYANEIVTAAFDAVGIKAQLQVMPYARCKLLTQKGEMVACFSLSPLPELENEIAISDEPLFLCYSRFLYNVKKPLSAQNQSEIKLGTTVGTVIGYEYAPDFTHLVKEGKIHVDESPSEIINIRKLALGRVDFALINYNDMKRVEAMIADAGATDQVKIAFQSGILKSYIGFSRKHPQGMWAQQQFNLGFATIRSNGTLKRIESRWLKESRNR